MNVQDSLPCRYHGCPDQSQDTVITNWATESGDVRKMDGEQIVTVTTIQGWVEEHCRAHAVEIVLWPPKERHG